jgi:hypothetical protein
MQRWRVLGLVVLGFVLVVAAFRLRDDDDEPDPRTGDHRDRAGDALARVGAVETPADISARSSASRRATIRRASLQRPEPARVRRWGSSICTAARSGTART